ncbi:LOW QUALITY PROTEIN: Pol protein [Phytophthora palmivora]|uniref:Pol protein n=1 Tax=Phytophthora palmivora TaxID=4796 RepID=A0A2P4XU86_9STRA|nr:LOW QUALITY PROTEIN: Pol protein [Phytophthora palmivora]
MEVHLKHLRRVFEVMRANKLYANIDKCVFAAEEIKKDADWVWEQQHQDAFDTIKASLQQAPVLDLPDENYVVWDASDYAIGCALLQKDEEGRERVISFQSRQLKAAERNYPVHDKELLAMKYALYTACAQDPCDHASLWTATNSPHLSQRMARWLSFFAEYNFRVEYKPGKLNCIKWTRTTHHWCGSCPRARIHRYELADGLLHYRVDPRDPPRVVVPNDDDLKYDILLEAHEAPVSGHLGREKTYQMVSQTFWWPRMYKWVAHHVKTCETCQRVKPSGHASAPLQSLPVPADCWKSMSLDFVFVSAAGSHIRPTTTDSTHDKTESYNN